MVSDKLAMVRGLPTGVLRRGRAWGKRGTKQPPTSTAAPHPARGWGCLCPLTAPGPTCPSLSHPRVAAPGGSNAAGELAALAVAAAGGHRGGLSVLAEGRCPCRDPPCLPLWLRGQLPPAPSSLRGARAWMGAQPWLSGVEGVSGVQI